MENYRRFFILQRRWVTFAFALLLLCLAAAFVVQPVLAFLLPLEAEGAKLWKLRTLAFVFAIGLGVPLLTISLSLFLRLRHKYAVFADEKGLYCYCGVIPVGLVSWDYVNHLAFQGDLSAPRPTKTLQIVMQPEIKTVNWRWRLKNCARPQNRREFRLFVSFFLCEGKEEENAQKVIALWKAFAQR